MPKFLFEASYTQDGVKGVHSAGGSSRRGSVTLQQQVRQPQLSIGIADHLG
jgi:hypothetical protein